MERRTLSNTVFISSSVNARILAVGVVVWWELEEKCCVWCLAVLESPSAVLDSSMPIAVQKKSRGSNRNPTPVRFWLARPAFSRSLCCEPGLGAFRPHADLESATLDHIHPSSAQPHLHCTSTRPRRISSPAQDATVTHSAARWPNGKAPDFGSGDCAFEPHVGRVIFFWLILAHSLCELGRIWVFFCF